MADTIAVSSSSDVGQSSQPPELPRQSGKHSIMSALAKPAYTFDGSNYGPWRCAFLEFLNAHGLRHHLTDSSPKESDPAYPEWSRLESAVCSWLISSVATQIMEPLSMTRPARALWLKLETMYANKSNVSQTVRLYEELFACRQGTRTLQTYYGAVDAIFTNLELYQPLVLDLDTLRRYRDEFRAGAFLSGLRPELADMIRGQVLGGSRVLPTEEIFAAALRVQDSFSDSQSSQPIETSALITSGGAPRASGKSAPSGRTRTSYPSCKYCGKTTHPSEKCWKEFGKPAWAMAAAGGKTSATMSPADGSSSTTPLAAGTVSLTLSPSELAYIQASRASSLCPPTAPSASLAALTSSLVSYVGGRGSSPGTPSISTPHTTSWIIDSGASSHMTGLSTILTSYRPETSIPDVRIADGRSCPVLGSGQSSATSSLPLQNVLYIPGFPANLLSISAITKALHCGVFYYPQQWVFQDLDTGRRIGLGRENGRDIYELVADSPSPGLQALFALSASSSSLHDSLLWHCRLGHPSFIKLKETLPWLTLSEFHCESCELGKHHRSSYPSRTGPPTHRPFDLVHCDVWGPASHPSPTGGKYYMVFVDDYTRASWTYILTSRKEVLSRVQHFLLEIITQYETVVKVLRTDNALEFTQKAIEELCLAHDIVHQTTCPYTSQQNGVAERKHRHLLDMVRTLLLAMRVPQYLWCEAVLTATYLVNRLPSATLGGAIPLQRLTPAADIFSLPPRVFGCTAFVQDHTPGLSKLAPRALKGVFVGYSQTQKGYRVYFPDRRQYVTSADVTFHEDVPYFPSTQSGGDLSSPSLLPSVSATTVIDLPMTAPPSAVTISLPEASPPSASLPSDPSSELEPPSLPLSPVLAPSPPPSPPPPVSDLDFPIALRKGTRQCTQYPIAHHVSPARLSPSYQSFALAVLTESIPKSYIEALQVPAWKAAMDAEYAAFIQRETWTLVPRPLDANVVSCKWVYSLKYNPDGSIARYKARLVAFLKPMVLTIMRHSRLWHASAPSVSFFLSLWISPGRFINWTCPMPSFTETSLRRYLWSNRLGTLLRGSLLRCVSSRRLSMG